LFLSSLALRAAIGAGLGLIAGSFVAAISARWPRGRSILTGRSACDSCAAPLGPLELVPLLSYAVQRGRCRRCGARIDPRHPAIELAAALLGTAAFAAAPGSAGAVSALLGWWLLLIAILDLEHQWLPDRLTLPLIPLGLLAAWAGIGPPLLDRVAGAAIGWAVLVLIAFLYRRLRGREGMGGGDPRLLGAVGAWVGAWQLPAILVGAGLVGLGAVAAMRLRGEAVGATSRLPLGTLMALAAWPVWLILLSSIIQPQSRIPLLENWLAGGAFP
jgi:leader peptidase (prepilin peptidase)/N-methyltransferase